MIRPATPADAPQIAAIWNQAIRETVSRYGALSEMSITDGSFALPTDAPASTSERAPRP